MRKKVIRLNESDLERLVNRILVEDQNVVNHMKNMDSNDPTFLRENLNSILRSFNKEQNLENKLQLAKQVRRLLQDNKEISGVDRDFLYDVFDDFISHLGSFSTAHVYFGNDEDINDGIEMRDDGYLFDNEGFYPIYG